VLAIVSIVAIAVGLFQGTFTSTTPVTVIAQRVGLVMNADAKVKMRDIEVGRVASIEDRPDGTAAIHLALDPSKLQLIPANVRVDVASTTVFGAKFVQLIEPAVPSSETVSAGQVIHSEHVTVEINTVFQQLTSVLSVIQPEKLNETLGAIASALNGRGKKFGQIISDLDALLAKLEPSLPTLTHDLDAMPTVLNTYADAAPDLMRIVDSTTQLSRTVLDEQTNLDVFLISLIGLADIGNDVLGANRQPLTDVLHLLVPTTDLTNQYNRALYCGIAGILPLAYDPPPKQPGAIINAGLMWGQDRWHYPDDLPKVGAKGGPQCTDMPKVPFDTRAPWVVTDTGANPWRYGNKGIVLNAAGLKQALFGDIDGPPRNSAQIGQPG
jgi:phospholipid/cholesterol/gamma-HCH transport system substrate-binding protein